MTAVTPWGLTRMRPFPPTSVGPEPEIVLDAETQTGRWLGEDGSLVPVMDRHKKSGTNKETRPKTSLDGTPDEGVDQEGDTD